MLARQKKRLRLWAPMLALALCVSTASAQQKDPRVNPPLAPLPPLSPGESSSKAAGETSANTSPAPAPVKPDTRPLSGAEPWTLGFTDAGRSSLLASFSIYQGGDTNRGNSNNPNRLVAASTVGGRLALQRLWGRHELVADYSGGMYYSPGSNLNTSFHQLGISHRASWRRWSFLLSDQLGYSPDASGGFGNASGFGQGRPGGGVGLVPDLGGLNRFLTPNQSILTARASRLSNTVVGEMQYTQGPRSSFTFSGSYGILHFFDSGFIDSSNTAFRAGYNYAFTGSDTFALIYGVSRFRYQDSSQAADNHVVQLAYGRHITGRLAFQVAAGPQVTTFQNSGREGDSTISWNLQTSLRYRFSRSEISLSYLRGVTGGSGVLFGAETNELQFGMSRRVSRVWQASWNFSYARNSALRQTTTLSGNTIFDAWGGGVQLSRPVGHSTEMYCAYSLQRQTVQVPGCLGPGCGLVGLRHVFGIGFHLRFRPIELD